MLRLPLALLPGVALLLAACHSQPAGSAEAAPAPAADSLSPAQWQRQIAQTALAHRLRPYFDEFYQDEDGGVYRAVRAYQPRPHLAAYATVRFERAPRMLELDSAQWEHKFRVAAAAWHLTPAFHNLYRDRAGRFYLLHCSSDFNDHSEEDLYDRVQFVPYPQLDATHHQVGSSAAYSADRHAVYYFCDPVYQQGFLPVLRADPATFRAVPGVAAGYDRRHVFAAEKLLPGLRPEQLRVFKGPANRSHRSCWDLDLYLTDGRTALSVRDAALTRRNAATFHPPAAYRLVYAAR